MKTARLCISVMVALTLTAAILTGCGGGGGGGGAPAPLLPAAFNVNGNWSVTETASATTVCDTVTVTAGRADSFTLAVVHTGLQSNLTVLDTRSSPPPLSATISDRTVTYSGSRYDPWSTGCGLTELAVVTLSTATHFTGTGTITCPGICSVPTTLVGSKP